MPVQSFRLQRQLNKLSAEEKQIVREFSNILKKYKHIGFISLAKILREQFPVIK